MAEWSKAVVLRTYRTSQYVIRKHHYREMHGFEPHSMHVIFALFAASSGFGGRQEVCRRRRKPLYTSVGHFELFLLQCQCLVAVADLPEHEAFLITQASHQGTQSA